MQTDPCSYISPRKRYGFIAKYLDASAAQIGFPQAK